MELYCIMLKMTVLYLKQGLSLSLAMSASACRVQVRM